MSGFEINQKVNTSGIGKDVLRRSEQCKKMSESDFESLWNKFNTNNQGDSANTLDEQEQVAMFTYFKDLAGSDNKVSRKEVRIANKGNNNSVSYKNQKRFEAGITAQTKTGTQIETENQNYVVKNGENSNVYEQKVNIVKSTVIKGNTTTVTNYMAVAGQIKPNTIENTITTTKNDDGSITVKTTTIKTNDVIDELEQTFDKNGKITNKKEKIDGKTKEIRFSYNDDGSPKEAIVITTDSSNKMITKKYTSWDKETGKIDTNSEVKEEEQQQTVKPAPATKPAKTVSSRISIPNSWKGNRLDENTITKLDLNNKTNSDDVFDTILTHFNIDKTKFKETDMSNLKADFIKYNPSMFNSDGAIHADADWNKLDFPKDALNLYKDGHKPEVESKRVRRPNAPKKEETPKKKIENDLSNIDVAEYINAHISTSADAMGDTTGNNWAKQQYAASQAIEYKYPSSGEILKRSRRVNGGVSTGKSYHESVVYDPITNSYYDVALLRQNQNSPGKAIIRPMVAEATRRNIV